jgi:AAA domain-containing protein
LSGNFEAGLQAAFERAASLPEPTRKDWHAATLKALGVGKDAASRFVFPIVSEHGELVGIVRYADDGREPKMRADKDTTRDLWPRPEGIPGEFVAVVEGEPDAVSATELGLPAVAIPGVGKWSDDWVPRITSHRDAVFFIPDCDAPGRRRMKEAAELASRTTPTFLIELDQLRDDGYDVGDLLADYGHDQAKSILQSLFDSARQYVPESAPEPENPTMTAAPAGAADDDRVAVWTTAADVPIRPVRFLWRPFLPLGKVTVLAGAPGQGKSQLTAYMAAAATRAGFFHSDIEEPGDAILMTAEDDLGDTVVPRLQAANADLSRVQFVNMRRTMPGGITSDGLIRLPGDLATLQLRLNAGGVRLVVLDPVASFVGREHSTYVNQDVRDVLDPVVTLAAYYGVAIVLVMHLNKSESKTWATKIGESHAFQAVARTVLALAPDPDDEDGAEGTDKILAATKLNVMHTGRGYAARLKVEPATVYAADMTPIETSTIKVVGTSSIAADDLLADQTERGARRDALDFLVDVLAQGPMEAKPLQAAAKSAGVSWRTVQRYYREVCKPAKPAMSRGPWVYELDPRHFPTIEPAEVGGHDDDDSKSANYHPSNYAEDDSKSANGLGQTTLGDFGGQTPDELSELRRRRRDAMLGERWDDDE